jgi:hypothetical protein
MQSGDHQENSMSCEEFVALGAGFPDKRVGFPESTIEFRVLHLPFVHTPLLPAPLRAFAIE